MGQLPVFLSNGATCLVSIRRLNGYLNAAELDPEAISHSYDPECAIRVCGASFTWNSPSNPTLKDINFAVPHGSLVAIVGTVGSGKSSLLSGILGDMEKIKGNVNVNGRIAYVPQQAWIQNASLKANVVFTSNFENAEEPRYQEVIRACCMEPDIAILADGDRTELGAKGINLSGGQKARISLARAVFSAADIYLLDDPLSAVDAHVGKRLFEEVIGSEKGLLKGKTRILVTHQVSILDQVDLIVVLKPGGTVSEKGTFQELMAKKDGDFAAFMAEHMSSVEEEEEE
ncbi:PREDICTED: multidrug resistance-associated protein 1-like, partial [Rhagoletis zephyria]|uniref:multidrug resistance-associated protein 1-like n=1 Tax=Rhagoletis zephyria TaxID=28612 RepID=UPI00081190E2